MLLCILPNQLFDKGFIPKSVKEIVLWEHPDFFTKYNYNKKKLLLHRSSMKCYFNYLNKHYKNRVYYVNFNEPFKYTVYMYFDPINKIKGFEESDQMIESPNFLMTKTDYKDIYTNKKSKSISFTRYFYPKCKEKINFLVSVNSTDKDNRESFDDSITLNKLPKFRNDGYIKEAIKYVNAHFENNIGNTDEFIFPITRDNTIKWLEHFIDSNLEHFGSYQDAFNKKHDNMFHSILSSSINIGLINPNDIIERLRKVEKSAPMNSLEGYVRQLCWREFQRYCYIYYDDLANKNFFALSNKINDDWYTGSTDILPIDNCIRKAMDTAYLHHIERLMVMGNFMVLSEIEPQEGHRWFMEFAIDSYEWVMLQNVYDMVFHNGNGLTSYKPYITSNEYIIKMSDYSRKHNWNDKWKSMYMAFLKKHKNRLLKYRYHFRLLKTI